ncbi:MAG: cation transporter [Candidatus Cloacimonadota bacterium]|nr:cation transporter [Candidatus Cloacimonadota bacterium]
MKTIYKISGMTCNHCVRRVEKAISSVEGVDKVKVSLAKGIAKVKGEHSQRKLLEVVQNAGYIAEKLN